MPHLALPGEGPFAAEARRLGVGAHILDVPAWRPWTIAALFRAGKILSGLLALHRIDLIHSYAPRNNILAARAARQKGIPVIWHERNLLWGCETDVTRLLVNVPDAVICNSRAVARRFEHRGALPGNVRVILNGVDLMYFTSPQDRAAAKRVLGLEGKKIVGLVSNLNARKGVRTFLETASLICRGRQDIHFVVVGGDHGGAGQMAVLQRGAWEMGLGSRVTFTGFQNDVRPYLAAFDVTAHVTEKEACSRAILESMAMGVPVVSWCDGGNPELIEDGHSGSLVPTGENPVFASRVVALVDNDGERERMGAAARARVEKLFDVRRNAQETMGLYGEML